MLPTLEEILEAIQPARVGSGIPTMTSGRIEIFDYHKALDLLRQAFSLTEEQQAWNLIYYLNNTYQGGPCVVFCDALHSDPETLPAFCLSDTAPADERYLDEDED